MKVKIIVGLLSLAFIATTAVAETQPAKEAATSKPGVLDGMTFVGSTLAEGESKPDPDNFIFKSGRFDSTACHEYGYGDANYSSSQVGKDIVFESQTQNTNGATIAWKGTVSGDKVSGNAVMTTAGGKENKFAFNGKLQSTASAAPTPTAQPTTKAVPTKKHS